MDYNQLNLAANVTTMAMTIIGLFAAITYYFSLIHLRAQYYLSAYVIIIAITFFIFYYIFMQPVEARP